MAAGNASAARVVEDVLGVPVDVSSWSGAVDRILEWAALRESKVVCFCNVHSIVTALQDQAHAQCLQSADMVAPDGAPVAWLIRRRHAAQDRISGPDLMMEACRRAAEAGQRVFLYGGTTETLAQLEQKLRSAIPALDIAGTFSPPFRELTDDEDGAIVDMINQSGASIVWVGLGCPKQEAWMYAHRGRINAVMAGVGAAFDFHAGVIKRAPVWMQRQGLEWLYRLTQDPRRLARRYAITNTLFMLALLRQSPASLAFAQAANRMRRSSDLPK